MNKDIRDLTDKEWLQQFATELNCSQVISLGSNSHIEGGKVIMITQELVAELVRKLREIARRMR